MICSTYGVGVGVVGESNVGGGRKEIKKEIGKGQSNKRKRKKREASWPGRAAGSLGVRGDNQKAPNTTAQRLTAELGPVDVATTEISVFPINSFLLFSLSVRLSAGPIIVMSS